MVGALRVLLVLTVDVEPRLLTQAVAELRGGGEVEVEVVAPMRLSRMAWLTDDDRAAREKAERRAARVATELPASAHGEAADPDPVQAIEDALATFPADEIVLVTHAEGQAGWLERSVFAEQLERFGLPVRHLALPEPAA